MLNYLINYLVQSQTIPGTQAIIEPNNDEAVNMLLQPQVHMIVAQHTGVSLGIQIREKNLSPELKKDLWAKIGAPEDVEGVFIFLNSEGQFVVSTDLVELNLDASTPN